MWIAKPSFQSAVPQLAPAADYSKVSLSPEEGFVLSRIDGAATINEIVLICGLPKDQALQALTKLHETGLINVPAGPVSPARTTETPAPQKSAEPAPSEAPEEPVEPEDSGFVVDPECELPAAKQRDIHSLYLLLEEVDFYRLLDIQPGCTTKDVQRAFRQKSLKYHPDRFFGKALGSFTAKLETIFTHLSNVYEYLCDEEQRAEYEESMGLTAEPEQGSPEPAPPAAPVEVRKREITREERLRRLGGVMGMSTRELMAQARRRRTTDHTPKPKTPTPPPITKERQRRITDHKRKRATQMLSPVKQRKEKARYHYEEGVKALVAGKFAAASSNLKLATTFDPKNEEYREKAEIASARAREISAAQYAQRAAAEKSIGQWEEAGRLYCMAAERNPIVSYLTNAADMLVKNEDLKRAVEYAKRATEVDPNSLEARLSLARAYTSAGMPKNARREVDQALSLDPDNARAKELLKEIRKRG